MAAGLTVVKFGDWAKAERILKQGMRPVRRAVGVAWNREAHFLRKMLWNGIRAQAPGGKQFKPLAPLTLAIRRFLGFRGKKALIWHADLIRSIAVIPSGRLGSRNYEVFVGVHRNARDKHGKPSIRIMELNEYGSRPIVVKMTPRMRRFLFAVLRKGQKGSDKPWWLLSRHGTGIVVLQIPPRPVFRPTWEMWGPSSGMRVMMIVQLELRGTYVST